MADINIVASEHSLHPHSYRRNSTMKVSTRLLLTTSVLLALVCGWLFFGTSNLSSPNAAIKNKKPPSFRLRNDTSTSGNGLNSTNINTTLTSTIEEEENVFPHEEKKKKGWYEDLREGWYIQLHEDHPRLKYILICIFVLLVVLQNVYAFGKFNRVPISRKWRPQADNNLRY